MLYLETCLIIEGRYSAALVSETGLVYTPFVEKDGSTNTRRMSIRFPGGNVITVSTDFEDFKESVWRRNLLHNPSIDLYSPSIDLKK